MNVNAPLLLLSKSAHCRSYARCLSFQFWSHEQKMLHDVAMSNRCIHVACMCSMSVLPVHCGKCSHSGQVCRWNYDGVDFQHISMIKYVFVSENPIHLASWNGRISYFGPFRQTAQKMFKVYSMLLCSWLSQGFVCYLLSWLVPKSGLTQQQRLCLSRYLQLHRQPRQNLSKDQTLQDIPRQFISDLSVKSWIVLDCAASPSQTHTSFSRPKPSPPPMSKTTSRISGWSGCFGFQKHQTDRSYIGDIPQALENLVEERWFRLMSQNKSKELAQLDDSEILVFLCPSINSVALCLWSLSWA